jgi:hypothetical protein
MMQLRRDEGRQTNQLITERNQSVMAAGGMPKKTTHRWRKSMISIRVCASVIISSFFFFFFFFCVSFTRARSRIDIIDIPPVATGGAPSPREATS